MANEADRYHIDKGWMPDMASDEELEKWAHDPNCIEMEECAKQWAERLEKREKDAAERLEKREKAVADEQRAIAAEQQRRSELRRELEDNPFNPRTEVSADAIHIASRIVAHLWIIFVLLPFVAALLWVILVASKSK
jgi:uncharacterized protein YeaO (DUF488 family)